MGLDDKFGDSSSDGDDGELEYDYWDFKRLQKLCRFLNSQGVEPASIPVEVSPIQNVPILGSRVRPS